MKTEIHLRQGAADRAAKRTGRPIRPIPIAAAKRIAEDYGYDQVMIYARRVGAAPDPFGEHMTTYGVTKKHCSAMAQIARFLQRKIMGWTEENQS